MATAYRAFDNKYKTWEEKRDILIAGESRHWADEMLKLGRKVEVGIFSVRRCHWVWHPYDGKRVNIYNIDD